MIIKTKTATLIGIDSHLVTVELSITLKRGSSFSIVGMGDKLIQESRKRLIASLRSCDVLLDNRDVMVNLSPAHIKKVGSHFDLSIAIAILQYSGIIKLNRKFLEETIFVGEISFDGKINSVQGIMAIILDADRLGIKRVVIPLTNYQEVGDIKSVEIIAIDSLQDFIDYSNSKKWHQKKSKRSFAELPIYKDFDEIKGQRVAKRMLQIAAAGHHNCIIVGPPGSGKTMLAQSIPSILPPLTSSQIMETARIHSVADGMISGLNNIRPFRNPHYGISQAGLVGGGSPLRPGEISLAHNGVLFLDELTEFRRTSIEALRQPLEDKEVTISRANGTLKLPCSFIMVAALNPCPCGNLGDSKRSCSCSPLTIYSYLKKISGPFLDRIDLQVFIQSVDINELHEKEMGWSSADLKEGVDKAHEAQKERFNSEEYYNCNLTPNEIIDYCKLNSATQKILDFAFEKFEMSMRSYHKIIKVARTIADIEGCKDIHEPHIKEALMYRGIEQKLMMLKRKI